MMKGTVGRVLLLCSISVCLGAVYYSQTEPPEPDFTHILDKNDVMIPMRDGVRLHTEIYVPKGSTEALPILIERTPYGTHDDDHGYSFALNYYQELVADRFVIV